MLELTPKVTRYHSFYQMDKLRSDGHGGWWREDGPSIDAQINDFVTAMDVEIVMITAPTVTTIGKDSEGVLHLRTAASILYLAEKEDTDVSGRPGDGGQLDEQQQSRATSVEPAPADSYGSPGTYGIPGVDGPVKREPGAFYSRKQRRAST